MRRKQMKWGVGLCSLAMLFSVLPANAATNTKKPGTEREQTYLVRMEKEQEKTTREKLKQTYEVSSTCSTQAEDELKGNQLMTVEMTPSEAAKLKKNSAIRFVEKDVTVKACTTAPAKKTISTGSLRKSEWEKAKNNRHEKKETRKADSTKSNREVEWNRQMIRAEKALSNIRKVKQNREKEPSDMKSNDSHKQSPVKIAVLDSGVDYWSDINLEESITLVPKEEEMSLSLIM